MTTERLANLDRAADVAELATLLCACVEGGASIGFLSPLAVEDARAYWQKIAAEVGAGVRRIWVVRDEAGAIVGSAQLALESRPNGRHRAEVQKVMVRPSARRKGIATTLMRTIETFARSERRWLLFLDTSDSHAGAREFYDALGYVYVGGIPDYALDPRGVPERNAIYYKTLALEA